MLDNMDQGIFTIDEQMKIRPGYSRQLEQIIGATAIAGQNCLELLFSGSGLRPDLLNACEAALGFSFGVESWLATNNSAHWITEFDRPGPDGQRRFFEVNWNLICDDADLVERVLVVVRDVTQVRRLKQTASENARAADIVSQVLESGLDAFTEFSANARTLLAESQSMLAAGSELSDQVQATIMRHLHTLKGNARLLSYTHMVDALHTAEERFADLRWAEEPSTQRGAFFDVLEQVLRLIDEQEDVCARKLAPLAQKRNGRIERSLLAIAEVLDQSTAEGVHSDALRRIRAALAGAQGVSLAELVKEVARMTPSLALELGKSAPVVHCQDVTTVLTGDWVQRMKDTLVQCFRNALYHGIEPRDARCSTGKTPEGHIRIETAAVGNALEVRISDDGRGLPLEVLRNAGAANRSPTTRSPNAFFSAVFRAPRRWGRWQDAASGSIWFAFSFANGAVMRSFASPVKSATAIARSCWSWCSPRTPWYPTWGPTIRVSTK